MGDWAPWGCNGKSIPGARKTAVGTGMLNSKAILQECNEPLIASRRCADYRGGGKDDWFLPSLDELKAIYLNLYKQGRAGLGLAGYWSSSETTKGYAWFYNFTTGDRSYSNKWPKNRVRCIRAFSETSGSPSQLVPVITAPPAPVTEPAEPLPKGLVLE